MTSGHPKGVGHGTGCPTGKAAAGRLVTYAKEVTDQAITDMRVGPEGRVVIPASIRRHLGVGPGDNLRFVLHADGKVEIVSPRVLAEALWANNTGGDAVDSAQLVRDLRSEDQTATEHSVDAQSGWAEGTQDADRLLREMGL